MRAVQNRAYISVPFSGSTLGVRIGSLAYNLAEAMAALTRGDAVSSLDFSPVSSLTSESVRTDSGVQVFTSLPVYEHDDTETNLDTFCPGAPPALIIADPISDAEEGSIIEKGLQPWAQRLLVTLGVIAVGLVLFVVFIASREKQGKPIFAAVKDKDNEVEIA